ncbi:cysteine hydrolase [candidate division KSB1 bacterium]|nr:cysteine hydrolase [candidate division KSB1 bacterium]
MNKRAVKENQQRQKSNHKALLVIDVQKGLFSKSTPVYHAGVLLENIKSLILKAYEAGAPVFFIRHSNTGWLKKGTDGWQLHDELVPADVDFIIDKSHSSAFTGTNLAAELQSRGVSHLVITGLVSNGCVKATCQDALQNNYAVTLAADAHSTFHKDAADIIAEWNVKFAESGIAVKPAADISLF